VIVADMRENQHQFRSLLVRLPTCLTAEQVAWVTNYQPHDIPVLVAAQLLKPLGNALPNSVKYFGSGELIELTEDRSWLAKVTNTITLHSQKKNERKKRQTSIELEAAASV
jgi:hypothetical protein